MIHNTAVTLQGCPHYDKLGEFLSREEFTGFTGEDLFIMQFIKKGWGQDIAALSNMAEALANIAVSDTHRHGEIAPLLAATVERALHPTVNPYKKDLSRVASLGKYGYYLEHLNIILGCYQRVVDDTYQPLNQRVTEHLLQASLVQENCHAPLLPHVKMRWSADQAAIIYSIWLYDQNNGTELCDQLREKWLAYMQTHATHPQTGLFITEVMGTQPYSRQPRGCATAYLVHYASRFAPEVAADQWQRFKKHMLINRLGITGFREYLTDYTGKWTPDSGPIVAGLGIAASGLALNAASSVGDEETHRVLKRSISPVLWLLRQFDRIPGVNRLSRVGTDLLATSIYLNADTKTEWFTGEKV
jgi:hypothetical protein